MKSSRLFTKKSAGRFYRKGTIEHNYMSSSTRKLASVDRLVKNIKRNLSKTDGDFILKTFVFPHKNKYFRQLLPQNVETRVEQGQKHLGESSSLEEKRFMKLVSSFIVFLFKCFVLSVCACFLFSAWKSSDWGVIEKPDCLREGKEAHIRHALHFPRFISLVLPGLIIFLLRKERPTFFLIVKCESSNKSGRNAAPICSPHTSIVISGE